MELEQQLKQLIIESLTLEDITAEDIGDQLPLFSDEGLGLDSVDALELALAIQKVFNLELDSEQQNIQRNFTNVATLADFIRKQSM